MMKEFKNLLGASLIALTFSFTLAQEAYAETSCVIPPSCSALGYTKTETDCAGMSILRCPFEQSNVFCVTAAEFPGGGVNVGDILYSDKTTNPNMVAGKTPIGIVFDTTNRLAVALNESDKDWLKGFFDIPNLKNYSSVADWNGRANTNTIISYCTTNSQSCPAAEYVNGYATAGTKAGDWYLPALGELNAIYGNKIILNMVISKAGGPRLSNNEYWSSSEYDAGSAWTQNFGDGTLLKHAKYNYGSQSVRPVLAF